MPRYRYECGACKPTQTLFHIISKEIIECPLCGVPNKMKKLLTTPTIVVSNDDTLNIATGELTKEYIESNREILEQQKKEAKEETYEPS